MSCCNTRSKRIATNYRVEEPISNFKFRVKIVQQRPLLADLLENDEDTRDSNFLEEEDRIFSWQEKVFGPYEVRFYSDEKNCTTLHQMNYYRQIKEENIQGSQLYTYTDVDSYYTDKELLTKPYRTRLSIRNESALPTLQNRKPFSERYNKTVVDDKPTETRIRSNHYVYTECRTMYVMADLSRKEEEDRAGADGDSETLLCTLTYDKLHKILTINPDFTDDDCYTHVNSSGVKFDYWIEHASREPSSPELQQRRNDSRRDITERLAYKGIEISHGLQLTPSNIQKVFLKLDIVSADNFSFDGLFAMYYIDLPEHWSTSQREKLFGRTQRCNRRNNIASFSYTSDLSLDCQTNKSLDRSSNLPFWPRILLSVASLDGWGRYRTEGYASLPLPVIPGTYQFKIPTWRPAGSIVNSLRRFFTGGTYELEDITYCGIPTGHDNSTLNKSNLTVALSGYIRININIIHQYHAFLKDDIPGDHFQSLNTDMLMSNIENIFEQFKAARERMIQVMTEDSLEEDILRRNIIRTVFHQLTARPKYSDVKNSGGKCVI